MRGENVETGYPAGLPAVEIGTEVANQTLLEQGEPLAVPEAAAVIAPVPGPAPAIKESGNTPISTEPVAEARGAEIELMADIKDVGDVVGLEAQINQMMEQTGSQ